MEGKFEKLQEKISSTLSYLNPLQAFSNNAEEASPTTWKEFTKTLLLKDLIPPSFQLISLNCDATVKEALKVLSDNKISCVPLLNQEREIIGEINVLDLVAYCTSKFSIRVAYLPGITERQVNEFFEQKVRHLFNLSGRDNWNELSETDSLYHLLNLFSEPDIHRAAIIDNKGNVKDLITQSKLLQFLQTQIEEKGFDLDLNFSTAEFPNQSKPVQCIGENEMLITAFSKIWEEKISGIGVITKDGRLIGNISSNDIKNVPFSSIGEESINFHILFQSCGDFLPYTRLGKALCINKKEPWFQGIKLINQYHVHRIFVIDDFEAPIGILTLCDFITYFRDCANFIKPISQN